jgi:hypothetical protein
MGPELLLRHVADGLRWAWRRSLVSTADHLEWAPCPSRRPSHTYKLLSIPLPRCIVGLQITAISNHAYRELPKLVTPIICPEMLLDNIADVLVGA